MMTTSSTLPGLAGDGVSLDFAKLEKRFRVPAGKPLRLADHDPGWAGNGDIPEKERKEEARGLLATHVEALSQMQELLWASDTWSVLVIFQAMDAAGKDGAIKHFMSGVNPQGVEVTSFKQPSAEELDHTFLWQCMKRVPSRGQIGIFNRSYYEDVLVVRVHQHLLEAQRVPDVKPGRKLWESRYDDIVAFERHLARNGTAIVKFFLNVSREEQKRRFLSRIDEPSKHWKFSPSDVAERQHWDDYMNAYEEAISATSTDHAPWYVVPADKKWVSRAVVSAVLTETIRGLGLTWPKISAEQRQQIEEARRHLEAE